MPHHQVECVNQVFWSLDHSLIRQLIAWFPRVKGQIASAVLDHCSLEVTLIPWLAPQKRTLIAWFNVDPGRKCFYTGHMTTPWSSALGWPGDGDCYLMNQIQSGGWHACSYRLQFHWYVNVYGMCVEYPCTRRGRPGLASSPDPTLAGRHTQAGHETWPGCNVVMKHELHENYTIYMEEWLRTIIYNQSINLYCHLQKCSQPMRAYETL